MYIEKAINLYISVVLESSQGGWVFQFKMMILKKKGTSLSTIGIGFLLALVLGLVFARMAFPIMGDMITGAATAYHNMTDDMSSHTDVYGTEAATFAGDSDNYLGWLWVIAPFLIAVGVILALVYAGRGRRGR